MLEAFFTRQRKRNIFVILTAITGLIWGGTQTIIVAQPPQASQTAPQTITTTDTTVSTNRRPLSQAQPVDTPTTKTDTTTAPATATTAPAASAAPQPTTSTQITAAAGKTERIETSDTVSYVLHYNLTVPTDTVAVSVTTTMSADINCLEPATKTFTYTGQTNLSVSCTVPKTVIAAAADQLTFKLTISNETAQYGSLPFVLAK